MPVKRVTAPPVYRPQPVPKVLQRKTAAPGWQPHAGAVSRRPIAPPVYRPEQNKIVQPKVAPSAVIQRRVPSVESLDQLPQDTHVVKRLRRNLMRTLEELKRTDKKEWQKINNEAQSQIRQPISTILTGTNYADLRSLTEIVGTRNELKYPGPARDAVRVNDPELSADYTTLKTNALSTLKKITSGTCNIALGEIFGDKNVETANQKYKNGHQALERLSSGDTPNVFVDLTGESEQMGKGGAGVFNKHIKLMAQAVRKPNDPESIVTLIHESLHAGNADVIDKGYFRSPGFETRPESDKLTNAAHFEELPRRLLDAHFIGGRFEPQSRIQEQEESATREASEVLRKAWTAALLIHEELKQLYKEPELLKKIAYIHMARAWSSTLGLTIHKHQWDAVQTRGVSPLDLSLSEGVIRKLNRAKNEVRNAVNHLKDNDSLKSCSREELTTAIIKTTLRLIDGPIRKNDIRDYAMVIKLSEEVSHIRLMSNETLPKQ